MARLLPPPLIKSAEVKQAESVLTCSCRLPQIFGALQYTGRTSSIFARGVTLEGDLQ